MTARRALLLGAASTALLAACGKSHKAPQLGWLVQLDEGYAKAVALRRPLLFFCWAMWDGASIELEHGTFVDGDIAAVLHTRFVLVRVDCSDVDEPRTRRDMERLKVLGTPSIIVVHAGAARELWRANRFLPPGELMPALREALARHEAIV
jgi:hypothetical protein